MERTISLLSFHNPCMVQTNFQFILMTSEAYHDPHDLSSRKL